ncbi:MAG: oxidative damage protection protein [Pseudomonadales bacterium]|nr:oxidative damage protection protein [Pseudomonadales bacterium]
MTRTVFCRKYQETLDGLPKPPFPGPKGQDIFDNVSLKAWQEWQKHQTMLINEKHLNMRDAEARQFLQGEMEKFLSGENFEQAEGYVPLDKKPGEAEKPETDAE